MGGKASPPPAPDPVAVANAQAAANQQSANQTTQLSRYNQYAPGGSSVWSQDPNNPMSWSNTIAYSPEQQQLYEQNNAINQQLMGVAQSGIGMVQQAMGPGAQESLMRGVSPFIGNVSGPQQSYFNGQAPQMQGPAQMGPQGIGYQQYQTQNPYVNAGAGAPNAGANSYAQAIQGIMSGMSNMGGQGGMPSFLPQQPRDNRAGIQPQYAADAGRGGFGSQTQPGTAEWYAQQNANPNARQDPLTGNLITSARGPGEGAGFSEDLRSGIDWSRLSQLPSNDEAARQQAEDVAYRSQARYLDPQVQRENSQNAARLANMGLTMGSPAWQAAMDQMSSQHERAYGAARDSAFQQGTQYQNQLFQQGLANRQQTSGEAVQEAGNRAQWGQIQGGIRQATLAAQGQQNAASAQAAAQVQAAQLAQQASMFGSQLGLQGQLGSSGIGAMSNLGSSQMASNASMYGNNVSAGTAQNQLGAQIGQNAFQNYLASIGAGNSAAQQNFANQMGIFGANNQAAQQNYQNQFANANLNNQTAMQQWQQNLAMQQNPINIINAMRSGSQMNLPNLSAGSGGSGQVAPTNVSGIMQQGYQNQLGAYNAQQAQSNFLPSMLGGIGGMMLGGPFGGAMGSALGNYMFGGK